jgi:hypothetical protein
MHRNLRSSTDACTYASSTFAHTTHATHATYTTTTYTTATTCSTGWIGWWIQHSHPWRIGSVLVRCYFHLHYQEYHEK